MAWYTCRWCPMKLNGSYNLDRHSRAAHPDEARLARAISAEQQAQDNLREYQGQLARYEAVIAELSLTLPPIARSLLERESRSLCPSWLSAEGSTPTEQFAVMIAAAHKRVRDRQADMASAQLAQTSPQAR